MKKCAGFIHSKIDEEQNRKLLGMIRETPKGQTLIS
jgi:hypothetical protein